MNKKSIFAALIGHALERYDVVLYGFFATLLAPVFFPPDSATSIISSLGTFAAGYLMRPVGAIYFGALGDRYGRKQAFLWSVIFVTVPTLIIGLLPTYAQIGIYSPLILVICRLFQGFCAGGEFTGAAIFIGEHADDRYAGRAGSLVCAVGFLGLAFGTLIGSITTLPYFGDWGWRIPFIFGALLTMWSYILRRNMEETPDFKQSEKKKSLLTSPLVDVLKHNKKGLISTISIGACGHVFLYSTTIYMNTVYKQQLHMSAHTLMMIDTSLILYWMLVVLIAGFLADRIGVKKLMSVSSLCMGFCVYPIYYMMNQGLSVHKILMSQIILITISAGFFGPATALFKEIFPTEKRYSGVAFGITLGQALWGGTTPMILEMIVRHTGDPNDAAFYIMGISFSAFASVYYLANRNSFRKYKFLFGK